MPEMIATSEIEYPPGKCWKPGDRFEVEDAHVALLEINGRAKLPDAEPVTPLFATLAQVPADLPPRRGPGRPPKAQ